MVPMIVTGTQWPIQRSSRWATNYTPDAFYPLYVDLFKYSIIQLQKWCCARPKNNGRGHRRQQDFVLSLRNVATAPCHYFLWLFRTIPFEKCCYSPLTISLLSLTPLLWAVQTRNRAHANTVWQEINIFNHNFYRSALRKCVTKRKIDIQLS